MFALQIQACAWISIFLNINSTVRFVIYLFIDLPFSRA